MNPEVMAQAEALATRDRQIALLEQEICPACRATVLPVGENLRCLGCGAEWRKPGRGRIVKRWWRYAVIRGIGIPAELDGRWFDVEQISPAVGPTPLPLAGSAAFEPTNRWEQRADGEVAVVYEMVR